MELKSASCPNCGAQTKNLKNCDYCGSIFIRFSGTELDPEKYIGETTHVDIYEGLEEKISEAIEKCKTNEFVNLCINLGEKNIMQLSRSSMIKDYLEGLNLNSNIDAIDGIGVVVILDTQANAYFSRFLELEESCLFFQSSEPDNMFFAIDYKYDAKGASAITSLILNKVFRINLKSKLSFEIEAWNDNEETNKKGCFVATATMGNYNHPTVKKLRSFRDDWILTKSWGNSFVRWYYHYGAIAAKFIIKSLLLKKISFIFIVTPLVHLSRILKKN